MRPAARKNRKQAIETAAMELLEEAGFDNLSMLAVAKRAKASNETLYRWYGDKRGLYKSLVMRNANHIRRYLETSLADATSPCEALKAFAPHLLEALTSPAAIALNRAAAADGSGELGSVLSDAGRDAVVPVLRQLIEAARQDGFLTGFQTDAAADLYLSLVLGDLQIRIVTRALPRFSEADIYVRAAQAWSFLELLSNSKSPTDR